MVKRIDITTTQNVVIDYKAASVIERFLAWLIDFFALNVSAGIILLVLFALFPEQYQNTILLLIVIITRTYHLVCEMFFNGVSLGKHTFHLRVVKINNEPVSVYDYFMRWAFRLIDIVATFGVLSVITIASSPRNQRIGDFLADTTVIKISKSNRFSLQKVQELEALKDYEPKYPEITALSEGDMLVIKEVVDRLGFAGEAGSRNLLEDTISQVEKVLDIKAETRDVGFLKILIKDYVALTR